jgi:hypothetical protein
VARRRHAIGRRRIRHPPEHLAAGLLDHRLVDRLLAVRVRAEHDAVAEEVDAARHAARDLVIRSSALRSNGIARVMPATDSRCRM